MTYDEAGDHVFTCWEWEGFTVRTIGGWSNGPEILGAIVWDDWTTFF